ncbi:MAG: polysulfide reductase NrfD [Actinobacteria bacterium]|nr:polysulfide reductase NrfD [Actinomycetota bacterium]
MSSVLESTTVRNEHPDVIEAAMRPFGKPSRKFLIAALFLAIVVAAGLGAWIYQLRMGMGVAGYTDSSFWAIYIADVVAIIGVSYGGAVVSAILLLAGASWRAPLVRLAEGTALVTVLVGAAFIFPHLGRPDRLVGMVIHANVASPVFWDMIAITTYTFATFVFFLLPLIPDTATLLASNPDELGRGRRALYRFISRGWVGSERQRHVLHSATIVVAIVIIPLAVSVHSVLAWAFALVSRPGWHESIWAPYFVIAALYSGVALVILVAAGFRRGYHLEAFITKKHFVRLGYIMVALGALYFYLTFADLLPSAYVGEIGPTEIVYGMLLGSVAGWFWLFLVAGTILPLVLVALPWTRNIGGIVIASILVVIAMWIKRVIMVIETSGYDRLTNSFGELFRFTWVSITMTVAGAAAITLLLMLLFRVVPMLSIVEMQELSPGADASDEGSASPTKSSHGRAAGVVGAVILLMVGIGAVGVTNAQPARAESLAAVATETLPVVTVTAVEAGPENTVTATVTLNGQPVPGVQVNFYESTTMFAPGDNQVPLGAMSTNETGMASIKFVAAVTGPRTITATYFPTVLGDPVVGTANLDVTEAVSLYAPTPPRLLATAGQTLALILFGVVIIVFAILIAQVVRVRRVCRPVAKGSGEPVHGN